MSISTTVEKNYPKTYNRKTLLSCLTEGVFLFKIKTMKRKPKAYKVCPRCGNKCLIAQERCDECDLVFARLQYASNKEAKKKIRKFDKDFVIYTTQLPPDVSWIKLLLLTFFTGLVGGQYYYVGKYWKGGIMTAGFVYLVFMTVFNADIVNALTTSVAYMPIGVYAMAWLVSLVYVGFKKFKVPVIVKEPTGESIEEVVEIKEEKKPREKKTAEVVVEDKKEEKTEAEEKK